MPTLLSFFAHMPAFDSQFPLVERLHARGKITVRNVVSRHLIRTEPRVEEAFRTGLVPYEPISRLRLEWFSGRAISDADAVLTHSDPGSGKALRRRDRQVRTAGLPVIMVQHGLKQVGLNYRNNPVAKPVLLHADLILLWQSPGPEAAGIFKLKPGATSTVVGLIKASRLPVRSPSAALQAQIDRHRSVALICHNYGFEARNYSPAMAAASASEWGALFDRHPETLFILRPHRGRKTKDGKDLAEALVDGRNNVVLSDRHQGPMAYSTIEDILAVSDFVFTHPSTVILDAAMAGVPVGVIDNHHASLKTLPQVSGGRDISDLLNAPAEAIEALKAFFSEFGDVERNLDHASECIEKLMT
jgi:hypothetical protein